MIDIVILKYFSRSIKYHSKAYDAVIFFVLGHNELAVLYMWRFHSKTSLTVKDTSI